MGILAALMLFVLTSVQQEQKGPMDIYVSAYGNDGWTGSLSEPNGSKTDGPLTTLKAAVEAARRLEAGAEKRIVLRQGDYYLDEPIVLDSRDSGLTIETAPKENATLHGGRILAGWRPEGERFWSAPVEGDFRVLVVNGRFSQRARLPETGRFTHLSEFPVQWMSTTGGGWQRKPTHEELTTLHFRPEDLPREIDLSRAELTVFHMWDESLVGVSSVNRKTHTITFANPAGHPPGAFAVKDYVVWNIPQGMKRPGQWYLDRSKGKVVYWPLAGEDMTKARAVAPTMESVIILKGTKENPLRNVALRGLSITETNTPLRAGGFGAGNYEGAVSVTSAENCKLTDLTIFNAGGQGIKAAEVKNLTVENCRVYDTGACGILARGAGLEIRNNQVFRVGVTSPSAIGLWIGGERGNVIHNEVHDTPYTAIAAGGQDHRIEKNRIYHAMQKLHDGAGIYITFCKRIALRGNWISDISDTGGYGASAYYLDEQAEDCVVEGNVSLRVNRPLHNHMAKNNAVRNNVFVVQGDAEITFIKSAGYTFEKNVIYATGRTRIVNPEGISSSADNVFFSGAGRIEGAPPGTVLADPLFLNSEEGCRFHPDSPAHSLGIEPLEVCDAGRAGPQKKKAD